VTAAGAYIKNRENDRQDKQQRNDNPCQSFFHQITAFLKQVKRLSDIRSKFILHTGSEDVKQHDRMFESPEQGHNK
jgi:hypothetical protein